MIDKEYPVHHKAEMLPILKTTAIQLFGDLTHFTQSKLLGTGTLEDLLKSCVDQYVREFELNFPSLGIAGAHEIAWTETLGDFNDETWEPED